MAAQNKQTRFFHGTNKFSWKTHRAVHLLQIIFNFLACPVPIRYSTEIDSKFFHLPPPICTQLPPSLYWISPEYGAKYPHLYLKQTLCLFYYLWEAVSHSTCALVDLAWAFGWCLLAPAWNTCTSSAPYFQTDLLLAKWPSRCWHTSKGDRSFSSWLL